MRGAPQVGFSATIRKINSRTSFGVCLRPTCLLPSRPEPVGNDPEQFVEAPQHGSRAATLQHSELLSERKILQGKTPTAMKHASERSEPEKKQIEHDPELYQNHGRTLQQVTDSTVGQSFGEAHLHAVRFIVDSSSSDAERLIAPRWRIVCPYLHPKVSHRNSSRRLAAWGCALSSNLSGASRHRTKAKSCKWLSAFLGMA